MSTATVPDSDAVELEARGVAFAVLARLLGPDPSGLLDETLRRRLHQVLGGLDARAAEAFAGSNPAGADGQPEADELARRWIRWFEHGRIAPYEASHVTASAGGITPRLADVAGFYRAFGVRVRRERPDHLVAELEFMAAVLLREAAARQRGDDESSAICHEAARSFVRDHLGTWVDTWAARVCDEPALEPWAAAAAATARLVAHEARMRNVVPLRTPAVLPHHVDPSDLDDDPGPSCSSEIAETT